MADNLSEPSAPIDASVAAYLAAIASEERRSDCASLIALMSRITGQAPHMLGTGIVGFGSYHYAYDSGHEGDAALTGFASRAKDLAIYLVAPGMHQDDLLGRLGRHKMGKACLTIRKLADVDPAVLAQLVAQSVEAVKRRYGS